MRNTKKRISISNAFDSKTNNIPLIFAIIQFIFPRVTYHYTGMYFFYVGAAHILNTKLFVCEPNINEAARYPALQVAFINLNPKSSYIS